MTLATRITLTCLCSCWIVITLCATVTSPANAIVDMRNLNYSNSWIDFPEKFGVSILRTYNSRSLFSGIFGFGWCSDFESSIHRTSENSYILSVCGAGQTTEFTRQQRGGDASRVLAADNGSTLEISDLGFIYRSVGGKDILQFDRMGLLSAVQTSGFGTVKIIRRYGKISNVIDWEGRHYLFLTSSTGKVLSIRTPDSLSTEYRYDQSGNLVAVRNAWKNVYRFYYDELHNLIRATYPDKTFIAIDYNKERDWVTTFTGRDMCREAYDPGFSARETEVYWTRMTKHCGENLILRGLYEFIYTRSSPPASSRLWKIRSSTGLPGRGGVEFTEVIYPEIGPPIGTREKRDTLHTLLLRPQ